ncbi:hypothetical protein [Nocardia nova]|jgi:hypothetical protein|nr:hypothetical protein [Nocardia nova]
MDHDQIEKRIGRILDIGAPARRIRAKVTAIDQQKDWNAEIGEPTY